MRVYLSERPRLENIDDSRSFNRKLPITVDGNANLHSTDITKRRSCRIKFRRKKIKTLSLHMIIDGIKKPRRSSPLLAGSPFAIKIDWESDEEH